MKTILVDARNFAQMEPIIVREMVAAKLRGFDTETFDDAHEKLREFRESGTKKVIFDVNRTTIAGFSLYAPDAPNAWYVNLNHFDAENRVPWGRAQVLLDCAASPLIIHNVPFERTMMRNSLGYELGDTICTLQMAVSNHGPDEYDHARMGEIVHWEFNKLLGPVLREFRGYDPDVSRTLNSRQEELLSKVVAKESDAAWSYNGFVKNIAYHYDLKRLTKSLFGRQMTTFEEVINTPAAVERAKAEGVKTDMRHLTGEEVCAYGGDDSYEAVQIFYELIARMRPEVLQAFITTENPLTAVYADVWSKGMQIDLPAVEQKFKEEEVNRLQVMESLRQIVQAALPFPDAPNVELMKREKWYYEKDKWQTQRAQTVAWAGGSEVKFNPSHYFKTRTILYDLFGLSIVFDQGKVASDADARGRMLEDAIDGAREVLLGLKDLASISQRLKLYLVPYQSLTDPETSRMYPVVSSKLATRRMAASFPNPMQLAKHVAESAYIRGFYIADI